MERESSLKDLIPIAPVIATTFAFAYTVGFFSNIDINWYSLFTLSEQMEFALRAFPIAAASSIIFVIGYNFFFASQRNISKVTYFLSTLENLVNSSFTGWMLCGYAF